MEDYVVFSCDTKLCIPSLYIDSTIVDWFIERLETRNYSKFVKDVWNITIKKVDFTEFGVKLIQFKSKNEFPDLAIYSELKVFIKEMMFETKVCMPWLKNKNMYCVQDDYDDLVRHLKLCGIWKSVTEILDYFPNWIEQKPLKLIIFKEDAFKSYKDILNKSINRIKFSLYITYAYPWHQPWNINYFKFSTDYLAIDICAGEWKRSNLLGDLNIFDILSLDLALCDANDYLNAYIERLFIRGFKFIKNLQPNTNKLEHFDLERYLKEIKSFDDCVPIDMYLYFIYSYGEHLKTINWANYNIKNLVEAEIFFFMIIKSIFPIIDIQKNKYITLKSYRQPSDHIVKDVRQSKYGNIILNISDYKQFSPDMLNELLKIGQVMRIEINVDDLENFHNNSQEYAGYIMDQKTIYLYSTSGGNVSNIENIIKCLSKFHARDLTALLRIIINNCVIDNYEIFKDFVMYSFTFQNMDIGLTNLRTFCSYQNNLKSLHFMDCEQFGDSHLIEVLTCNHLKIKRLSIDGINSVTVNFYFMYAEHQMRTKNITNFKIRSLFPIINLKSMELMQNLTYVLDQQTNKIEVKNIFNENIDIYDLFYSSDGSNRDMYEFYE